MIKPLYPERPRNAPCNEFRKVSTSLDVFLIVGKSPTFMLKNMPIKELELKSDQR